VRLTESGCPVGDRRYRDCPCHLRLNSDSCWQKIESGNTPATQMVNAAEVRVGSDGAVTLAGLLITTRAYEDAERQGPRSYSGSALDWIVRRMVTERQAARRRAALNDVTAPFVVAKGCPWPPSSSPSRRPKADLS
jgi:hypothetical protein